MEILVVGHLAEKFVPVKILLVTKMNIFLLLSFKSNMRKT